MTFLLKGVDKGKYVPMMRDNVVPKKRWYNNIGVSATVPPFLLQQLYSKLVVRVCCPWETGQIAFRFFFKHK